MVLFDEFRIMKELKFTLGEAIRISRENKGMTRTKLAEFTGISPNTLAKYEKAQEEGGKIPGLSRMVKIARVLEMDPRGIFDRAFLFQREKDDDFNFVNHFATDIDWVNWKLNVKTIDDLNSTLDWHLHEFHSIGQRLEQIEKAIKENDPDQKDPGRSENSTLEPKAVDAAPNSRNKKKSPS